MKVWINAPKRCSAGSAAFVVCQRGCCLGQIKQVPTPAALTNYIIAFCVTHMAEQRRQHRSCQKLLHQLIRIEVPLEMGHYCNHSHG